jgi:soluble cytochrome b562
MSNASTIRPGLLVNVKSTVVGGVSYQRIDLETGKPPADDAEVTRWETTRVIEDKEEHERATKCRSNALSLIRRVCSATTFGLLCPNEQEGALDAAVKAARQLVDNHNENAQHTRVGIYVLKGRVASDDAEAARAITQEIAELTVKMDAGIKNFDPKAIRDAANRAREMSSMLSESAQTKINGAIEQARKAARQIVKRIETEGEDRSVVLMDIQRGQIESARIAFLDMSGETTADGEVSPSVQPQRFADLDIETNDATCAPSKSVNVPAIELAEGSK